MGFYSIVRSFKIIAMDLLKSTTPAMAIKNIAANGFGTASFKVTITLLGVDYRF